MSVNFTSKQQKVIDIRNKDILVSAAAGSGKTAVLVERIIQKVCDTEHPVDIDRMLIVTFTQAAAAEMRERIGSALMKELEMEPDNEHLQRQSSLLYNAKITTIDSFCLFLIRNHFNDIGLDPGFRVADEGEIKLMKADVMKALLEDEFERNTDSFCHFIECFSTGRDEKKAEEYIERLYDFSMSYPWPEDWLFDRKQDYRIGSLEELKEKEWFLKGLEQARFFMRGCLLHLAGAEEICSQADGPYMYLDNLALDRQMIENMLKKTEYEELQAAFLELKFSALSRKKDTAVDSWKREQVKDIRNSIKKEMAVVADRYFKSPLSEILDDLQYSCATVEELVRLTQRFKECFEKRKREGNILDFSDMEHFALQILLEKDGNQYVPTQTARDYQEYFEEVMIDEYQDSNEVQELILSSVSAMEKDRNNRFMVGDVKQSIYRFRMARPEIFLAKYQQYGEEGENHIRIDLNKNFRSRREVVDSVNDIFSKVMQAEIGKVSYDKDAALYLGAEYYPEGSDGDFQTEFLIRDLIDKDEKTETAGDEKGAKAEHSRKYKTSSKKDKIIAETEMIAVKIQDLMKEGQVTDKDTGILRRPRYSDIVILLRTASGVDDIMKDVLQEQGIPVHIASKKGYFKTTEIRAVINYLKILDNPLQDIPLYGVLSSVLGGFTEEELTSIRLLKTKGRLYHALTAAGELADQGVEEWKGKAARFLKQYYEFRSMVPYTSIQDLLQHIFKKTNYRYLVGAMAAGEQREGNLQMLLEKAAAFEGTSYHGLFHFIRYIEQMKEYDVDFGEANILDENANVVRIMTIHKSKGLEFPICFVAGLWRQFNVREASREILLDMDMGIGMQYINPSMRIKKKGLRKNVVADKMRADSRGEDLRVLYVALTRAREKLILTGITEDREKEQQRTALYEKSPKVPSTALLHAASFQDILLFSGTEPCYIEDQQLKEHLLKAAVAGLGRREELHRAEEYMDASIHRKISEKFSHTYAHANLEGLYTKTTVSELKMAALREAYGLEEGIGAGEDSMADKLYESQLVVPYIPRFAAEEAKKISGSIRGSAYHRVMELLDFEKYIFPKTSLPVREELLEELKNFVEEGRLSLEFYHAVLLDKIEAFLRTPLAARMARAQREGKLYREQPFVLGIPAIELNKKFPAEEQVLIQGVIDAFFEEEGKIILLDYKTDVIEKPMVLASRYAAQIEYYERALQRILGGKDRKNVAPASRLVGERILYSFYLEKEVHV